MARGRSAAAESSWDLLRDQALGDLQILIEHAAETRKTLREYQSVLEKIHRHLARGGRMSETPALFDTRSVRATVTDRLNRFEQVRNVARLSVWRLQVAEGTTIAEIARVWGVSRQLVSRALTGGNTPPAAHDR